MHNDRKLAHLLYKQLLHLYPCAFRQQFGESMMQTFNDLYNERKRQPAQGIFSFVLWLLLETAQGGLRERLRLMLEGGAMQAMLKNIGASTLIGVLLILPLMIMQIVNRRNFNEAFPVAVFVGLWFSLFAISLILLPIVGSRWTVNSEQPVPAQRTAILTNPKTTLVMSVVLILFVAIPALLASLGLALPNPEQLYVFGIGVRIQFIIFIFLAIPVVSGIIAGRPIVNSLRAGSSLLVHPLHLVIVVAVSLLFAAGFVSIIVDQWPCFLGVPNCD
jgi:hypothetical protein